MIHLPWYVYLGILPLVVGWKLLGSDKLPTGKVIGIVGKMGSGKSYMATRIAYKRMLTGARIVTNFTMHLECPGGKHRHFRCPCKLAGQWQKFRDWPDLLTLSNAVIIIDEADLFAPSNDFNAITDEVRWKMKMARKHRLDIYWISQHENRMNRILREYLTNEIAICRSFFGGKYFSAKFYDPSNIRKGTAEHTMRIGYFLNKRIANLYDTLETIEGSEYAGDETMGNVTKLVDHFESNRIIDRKARRNRQIVEAEDIELVLDKVPRREARNGPNSDRVRQRNRPKAGLSDSRSIDESA